MDGIGLKTDDLQQSVSHVKIEEGAEHSQQVGRDNGIYCILGERGLQLIDPHKKYWGSSGVVKSMRSVISLTSLGSNND